MKACIFSLILLAFCACRLHRQAQVSHAVEATNEYYGADNGIALSNPLMGWQCYGSLQEIARHGIPDEFDIGVALCSWDQLEPEKNRYDFALLDSAVQRLRQDGKTVYLRLYLMPDNVWRIAGYPAWIKDEPGIGVFKSIHFDHLNGNRPYDFEHPDYSSPVWQGLVSQFLKYVANHYADGVVDVIDARAYGLYGEWDSNWGNYWDTIAPTYSADKTATLSQIVELYKDAFRHYELTKIAFNVSSEWLTGTAAETYLAQAALDRAFEAGFAVRFDGAGDGFDISRHVMQAVINRYFPASPVFTETWYGWGYPRHSVEEGYDSFLQVRSNGATYGFSRNSVRRALAYDPDFFAKGLKPNVDGVQLGYRILPAKVVFNRQTVGNGEIRFSSEWVNTGVGVLYRHYPLKLSLINESGEEVYASVREDFNITRLVRGDTYSYNAFFSLPGLAPGVYMLQIALVHKNNPDKSMIRMPIGDTSNTSANYVIGTVTICND
ncbi:MAG: DUF4832 domain-containing protein [Dysgonamonadaceae bacterium]|jgi:hypothetical protein|nr:DUF4832 domain-containing protein [Dysgonamonadaceae bacterium]